MGIASISDVRAVLAGALVQNRLPSVVVVAAIAVGVALGLAVQVVNQSAIDTLTQGVRTLSGAVSLENADSSDLTVSTLGGPVTIRQLKARSADLRTVAGDIVIEESDTERLIAQSLSGRIELTGRLARTGRYSLQSQSGNVRLTPIGSNDFELEAATASGSVRSDYELTLEERQVTRSSRRGA